MPKKKLKIKLMRKQREKSKISALRKDPRPYSRCLYGVFVMNFGFTLTPTITLTITPKEADTSQPPEQTKKQV